MNERSEKNKQENSEVKIINAIADVYIGTGGNGQRSFVEMPQLKTGFVEDRKDDAWSVKEGDENPFGGAIAISGDPHADPVFNVHALVIHSPG